MEWFILNVLLNLLFGKDGLRYDLQRLLFVFDITSNELLNLSMILFIPQLMRNASFPTCSESAPRKKL